MVGNEVIVGVREENDEILSHNCHCPRRNSNQASPEFKLKMLPLHRSYLDTSTIRFI
jgi:hypothetical protein